MSDLIPVKHTRFTTGCNHSKTGIDVSGTCRLYIKDDNGSYYKCGRQISCQAHVHVDHQGRRAFCYIYSCAKCVLPLPSVHYTNPNMHSLIRALAWQVQWPAWQQNARPRGRSETLHVRVRIS